MNPYYTDLTKLVDVYTNVQSSSSLFLPTQDNLTITTDIDPNLQGSVLGGLTFRKNTQLFSYDYLDYNLNTTTISGVGNFYSGVINLPISFSLNNNFITFNNLEYFDGSIEITITSPGLTAINFPALKGITSNFVINASRGLSSINLENLQYIGGYIGLGGIVTVSTKFSEDLLEFNLPNLEFCNAITIGGYGTTKAPIISSISFPKLKIATGQISIGGSNSYGNVLYRPFSNLQILTLSSLEIMSGLSLTNIPTLTSFTLENVKNIKGNTVFSGCTALREVSYPNLLVIGGYSSAGIQSNTPSLTSISIPIVEYYVGTVLTEWGSTGSLRNFEFGTNTLKLVNSTIFNVNQTLTQQSVDNLLKAFANLDGTNGTTVYGTGKALGLAGSNSAPSYTGGVTTTTAGTNFVRTDSTVVASVVGHGHTNGDIVTFTGNGQAALNGTYIITVNSPDEFQYTTPTSGSLTGSGTVTMRRTTVATDGFRYFQTIALRGVTVTINFP